MEHATCYGDLAQQNEECDGIQSRLLEETEQTRALLNSQEEHISKLGKELVIASQELEEQNMLSSKTISWNIIYDLRVF